MKRILLKPHGDELVDFSEISKLCCIKEAAIVNGEQKIVTKFDLSLYDDLAYITEAIENMLLQTQLQAIKQMSTNVGVALKLDQK